MSGRIVGFVAQWTPLWLIAVFLALNIQSVIEWGVQFEMLSSLFYSSWLLVAATLLYRLENYIAGRAA